MSEETAMSWLDITMVYVRTAYGIVSTPLFVLSSIAVGIGSAIYLGGTWTIMFVTAVAVQAVFQLTAFLGATAYLLVKTFMDRDADPEDLDEVLVSELKEKWGSA